MIELAAINPSNLLTVTKENLQQLDSRDVANRIIRPEEVTHLLQVVDAQWQHPGGTAPHAVLTSGLHSNGFVDTLKALSYTNLCFMFAHQLTKRLEEEESGLGLSENWKWSVGSDHAGAVFSQNVGIWLGTRHDFTAKGEIGGHGNRSSIQRWDRLPIGADEIVLQIEELMTTAKTMMDVRQGIREFHDYPIKFASLAGVLVHRSDVYEVENSKIVYLVHYDIQSWRAEECPLCQAGSEPIKEPKKNWARLIGQA
jgi:hypothetical protein